MQGMVIRGELPPDVQAFLDRRRELGQDIYDEVWEGQYHVAPAPNAEHGRVQVALAAALLVPAHAAGFDVVGPFNLGAAGDYRVPVVGVIRPEHATSTWVPEAFLVVEVVSPDDETHRKLPFYVARAEVVAIVDPADRDVSVYRSSSRDRYDGPFLGGVTGVSLAAAVGW